MHAYLITGENSRILLKKAQLLAQKISVENFHYSLTKISQVRELANFLKLSVSVPTTILIKDIEDATEETLNAFLKMLEEPQKNVKYILIASSEYKIIPTISSRCQLIKIRNQKSLREEDSQESATEISNSEIANFLKMSIGGKFLFVDKIRKRSDALKFTKDYVLYLHKFIDKKGTELKELSHLISIAQDTINKIKANGNINLNLNNLVIKSQSFSFTGNTI